MFRSSHHPSWSNRLTAVLGIALVLLLNALAASAELHARLHGRCQASERAGHGHEPVGDSDHACAVTLFSHGATPALFFCLLLLQPPPDCGTLRPPSVRWDTRPLRYWHAPAHAPPLA